MIKKYIPLWAIAAAMLVAAIVIGTTKKSKQQGKEWLPIDLHAIKMTDGWGYEVLVDKKVFIHQDCIPAIALYKKFSSETDALLIGDKVVKKIKKGQKPSITLGEIEESGIRY